MTHKQNVLSVFIVAIIAMSGCGAAPEPATPTLAAVATAQPTNTALPAATPLPTATATSIPRPTATPTSIPTATSTATPLPTATAELTITPQSVHAQNVQLTPLPTDATTMLSATEQFSITEVPPPMDPVPLPPDTINIALLGVDTRPGIGPNNTDVIIIASIRPDVPAVTLLSIPRDVLVYIPGWRSHKVNTAFAKGGFDMFRQTILYNFGINVDYHAVVNFHGVVRAVDTLGGVDIVATCPVYQAFPADPYYMGDPTTPLTVTQVYTNFFTGEVWQPGIAVPTMTLSIESPGVYNMDGLQALAFVRARYGVPGGDVDRGRRQQILIRALLQKVLQVKVIPYIPQLYADFQRDVRTDLTLENVLYFAGMAGTMNDAVIRSRFLDSSALHAMMLPEVGSVFVMDREKMREYLQKALNVALNQRPNDGIPIELWYGTGNAGFGAAAASRLRELGFAITEIRDAGEYYPKTLIMDYNTTAKGSAIPLLLRTFKLKPEQVVANPNPEGPRYRIIAGADFDPCYYRNGGLAPVATPTPTP